MRPTTCWWVGWVVLDLKGPKNTLGRLWEEPFLALKHVWHVAFFCQMSHLLECFSSPGKRKGMDGLLLALPLGVENHWFTNNPQFSPGYLWPSKRGQPKSFQKNGLDTTLTKFSFDQPKLYRYRFSIVGPIFLVFPLPNSSEKSCYVNDPTIIRNNKSQEWYNKYPTMI